MEMDKKGGVISIILAIIVLALLLIAFYMGPFLNEEMNKIRNEDNNSIQIEQLYSTLNHSGNTTQPTRYLMHISKEDLDRSISKYVKVDNNTTAGVYINKGILYLTTIATDLETGQVYAKTEVKPIE